MTVRAGQRSTADFVLVATGILEGEVRTVDGRPGEAGLPVLVAPDREVVRLNDVPRVEVVEGGRYRVELPAGDFKALAGKLGRSGASKWARAKVAGGETTRLDLVAAYPEDSPDTLAIEVREPGGAPAGNAFVTVERPGYMWMSSRRRGGTHLRERTPRRGEVDGEEGRSGVAARRGCRGVA